MRSTNEGLGQGRGGEVSSFLTCHSLGASLVTAGATDLLRTEDRTAYERRRLVSPHLPHAIRSLAGLWHGSWVELLPPESLSNPT